MMISSLILATACLGQVCVSPVYVPSNTVVIAPPLYIDYRLGGMSERTREYKNVPYRDGKVRRVPVINGYVPRINHTKYSSGAERIVYDYTIWESYEGAMAKWKQQREAALKKKQPPVLSKPKPPEKPQLESKSVLAKPEPTPDKPKELELNPPANMPVRPEPEALPEPLLPQPEPKYLTPVVPSKNEPRVVIPPSYREN